MPDDLQKAQERIDALERRNATLEKVAALTPAHKGHYDTLEKADQAAFLDLAPESRDNAVAKAAEADGIVYTAQDGTEFRKSDDPRLVAFAKQADADRQALAKAEAARLDAELAKRADEELPNLPGDLDVRKALLKAVEGIDDETTRTGALDALKAHDNGLSSAFETAGHGGSPVQKNGDQGSAEDELDRLAKAHAAEHGVDYYTAYEAVSQANRNLLAKAIG